MRDADNSDHQPGETGGPRSRNAQATRKSILDAGIAEFCEHGLSGASTARIVERAGCNIRMLYHYFQSKELLYKAALQEVYNDLRSQEAGLNILDRPPVEAIEALTAFTYDYMAATPTFIKMVLAENLLQGEFIRAIESIPRSSRPLIETIQTLLDRGEAAGVIQPGINAMQLYISIVALSFIHISSRYTLSVTFGVDLSSEAIVTERRQHVVDLIGTYVKAQPGRSAG